MNEDEAELFKFMQKVSFLTRAHILGKSDLVNIRLNSFSDAEIEELIALIKTLKRKVELHYLLERGREKPTP